MNDVADVIHSDTEVPGRLNLAGDRGTLLGIVVREDDLTPGSIPGAQVQPDDNRAVRRDGLQRGADGSADRNGERPGNGAVLGQRGRSERLRDGRRAGGRCRRAGIAVVTPSREQNQAKRDEFTADTTVHAGSLGLPFTIRHPSCANSLGTRRTNTDVTFWTGRCDIKLRTSVWTKGLRVMRSAAIAASLVLLLSSAPVFAQAAAQPRPTPPAAAAPAAPLPPPTTAPFPQGAKVGLVNLQQIA